MNATAAYLWKEVEGKDFNQADLADLLVKKYGIDEELAQKDAAAVLDKWIEIGLVK